MPAYPNAFSWLVNWFQCRACHPWWGRSAAVSMRCFWYDAIMWPVVCLSTTSPLYVKPYCCVGSGCGTWYLGGF